MVFMPNQTNDKQYLVLYSSENAPVHMQAIYRNASTRRITALEKEMEG